MSPIYSVVAGSKTKFLLSFPHFTKTTVESFHTVWRSEASLFSGAYEERSFGYRLRMTLWKRERVRAITHP
jgi:hypothetical protein